MRRNVQIVGWSLIWGGLFIFGFLGWQLYGTDLVNAGVQAEAVTDLQDALVETQDTLPQVEEVDLSTYLGEEVPTGDGVGPTEVVEFHPEDGPEKGEPMAFLRVDKIGLDEVLFEGVDRETLKKGPGHMEWTPLPGQPGNAVVSGHRTTYGRPFFDLDLLEVDDLIEVETAIGVHTYAVREIQIVTPTDVWVTDPRPGAWLTLTTCEPKFSARQRLIVFAELISGPNLEFAAAHKQKFES